MFIYGRRRGRRNHDRPEHSRHQGLDGRGAVLFGSFARGEQDDDSDVDLVVAFDRKIGYLELESLRTDLAESFGRDVDLITTFGNLPRYMLEEIRRDGVAVYGR